MKKMYFTKHSSYIVEQNEDGTLRITKTSTMKPIDNAGSFIVSQGGIAAILTNCKEVSDEDFAKDRKQLRLRYDFLQKHNQEVAMTEQKRYEAEYKAMFHGEVVETTHESIRTLLRYLNGINWGTWQLPAMTIGYTCGQHDCNGKIATTIKLDKPIEYRGEMVKQFQFGAPSGFLTKYRRIQ